jgi:hypothetical protein
MPQDDDFFTTPEEFQRITGGYKGSWVIELPPVRRPKKTEDLPKAPDREPNDER